MLPQNTLPQKPFPLWIPCPRGNMLLFSKILDLRWNVLWISLIWPVSLSSFAISSVLFVSFVYVLICEIVLLLLPSWPGLPGRDFVSELDFINVQYHIWFESSGKGNYWLLVSHIEIMQLQKTHNLVLDYVDGAFLCPCPSLSLKRHGHELTKRAA